eukprot:tig00000480_g1334.t1
MGAEEAIGECVNEFFPCSRTITGNLFLMLAYGFLLARGSKLIADGSELLMQILDPGIIGGLVLPLLGGAFAMTARTRVESIAATIQSTFPDACIIFVSCLGGDIAEVQEQLSVGVGTLAGSTVMLLTLPWAASLYLGRCDLDGNGQAIQKRCTKTSLTESGVTTDEDVPLNAKIMLATSLPFLIAQGPALAYFFGEPKFQKDREANFALAGFVVSFILLVAYSVWQVMNTKLQEKKMEMAKKEAVMRRVVERMVSVMERRQTSFRETPAPGDAENPSAPLAPAQPISGEKVASLGLKWKAGVAAKKEAAAAAAAGAPATSYGTAPSPAAKEEEEGSDDETAGMTKREIAIKSVTTLAIGTAVVSFFSDPMVDSISQFATEMKLSPFFVAFIVAPTASNASELIASCIFAAKKTKKSISLTYGSLYGAATMNNTLCLGIFLFMVWFRKLAWDFSAEVACILFVELAVALVAVRSTTIRLRTGFLVAAFYFVAIGIVAGLNRIGWH